MSKEDKSVLVSLVSGMFAGSFARVFTHPIDTVKSKVQVMNSLNIRGAVNNTLKTEGVKGLYRGISTVVFGSLPGCVLYFGSYEYAKKNLLSYKFFRDSEFLSYFISGMFAETIACLVFVPVDVIKERLQVQSNLKTYAYKNDVDAFKTVVKTEGVRGVYKAYGATVMSFGPFSAINFMFFEYFKGFFVKNDAETYSKRVNEGKKTSAKIDLAFHESIICSALSNLIAATVTNPLDLVKLRMQVHRANSSAGEAKYRNMFHGLGVVAKEEGIRGLFKGSIARASFFIPTGALTFSFLESIKPIVRKALE